ncbi:MATE family efflux transporter [Marinilabiliaceae bacterium ANBcel2]|nr:MATE family efflux transporter [Marinilabiliaceae bacterium ANBcel2]
MKSLTEGSEGKIIFKFALPMVIGNLMQQLYILVDSIIVGQFIGDTALAAVGASFPVFYTLIAFFIGIGSGATIVISHFFGAQQYKKVKEAIGTIYIFMFGAGLILTAIGIIFSREIFTLLNVGEDVMPEAITYFTIYMTGMVGFFGFHSTSSVLRGLGDSKTPLLFLAIATVANLLLDLLFIVVLNMGIEGAAWATVISQMGAFIVAIFHLNSKDHLIHFSVKSLIFNSDLFKKSAKIGLPTGFQQSFVALGMMAIIRIINEFDTEVLTAYTAASKIDALASMPAMTLASALSAFVGQNMGAGLTHRVKKGLLATLKMAWTISLSVMIIVIFFGSELMALFSSNEDVIDYGKQYLIIICSFYVVFSSMFIMHGTLRGAGDTMIPMFITLISLWLIRIPFAWILSRHFGEAGIWWSIPAGWIVGLAGTWLYYISGKWKNKKVTDSEILPQTTNNAS